MHFCGRPWKHVFFIFEVIRLTSLITSCVPQTKLRHWVGTHGSERPGLFCQLSDWSMTFSPTRSTDSANQIVVVYFNKMTEFCCLCPYLMKYLEYFIITVACVFGFSLACSTGVVLGIQKLLSNPVRSQIIVSPHPQEVFNLTQSLFLYPMCLLSSGCARF